MEKGSTKETVTGDEEPLEEEPEESDELSKGEEELEDEVGFDDPGEEQADALETGGPFDA